MSIVSTDKAHAYHNVQRELELACHNTFDATEHKINRINNVHSILEGFTRNFYGASSRCLESYLTWLKWYYSFKGSRTPGDMSELVIKQAVWGTYDTTWREYKNMPHPFWEYWNSQVA